MPYRSLDPSRLKLTGRGSWDCREYLSDLFYLPFVEPRVNMFDLVPPPEVRPDFASVREDTVVELCKVWDAQNLLRIFPVEFGPGSQIGCTKVFNNFKNVTADRQIGDRRSQNFREGKIPGPSCSLPTGAALLQLAPKRYGQQLLGCVTDRRDFYHQFMVTDERATTNCFYPFLRASQLSGTGAFEEYLSRFAGRKGRMRGGREEVGDFLHQRPILFDAGPDSRVVASFGALFQGDHLGVEIATEAHFNMLQSRGLFPPGSRLPASAGPSYRFS